MARKARGKRERNSPEKEVPSEDQGTGEENYEFEQEIVEIFQGAGPTNQHIETGDQNLLEEVVQVSTDASQDGHGNELPILHDSENTAGFRDSQPSTSQGATYQDISLHGGESDPMMGFPTSPCKRKRIQEAKDHSERSASIPTIHNTSNRNHHIRQARATMRSPTHFSSYTCIETPLSPQLDGIDTLFASDQEKYDVFTPPISPTSALKKLSVNSPPPNSSAAIEYPEDNNLRINNPSSASQPGGASSVTSQDIQQASSSQYDTLSFQPPLPCSSEGSFSREKKSRKSQSRRSRQKSETDPMTGSQSSPLKRKLLQGLQAVDSSNHPRETLGGPSHLSPPSDFEASLSPPSDDCIRMVVPEMNSRSDHLFSTLSPTRDFGKLSVNSPQSNSASAVGNRESSNLDLGNQPSTSQAGQSASPRRRRRSSKTGSGSRDAGSVTAEDIQQDADFQREALSLPPPLQANLEHFSRERKSRKSQSKRSKHKKDTQTTAKESFDGVKQGGTSQYSFRRTHQSTSRDYHSSNAPEINDQPKSYCREAIGTSSNPQNSPPKQEILYHGDGIPSENIDQSFQESLSSPDAGRHAEEISIGDATHIENEFSPTRFAFHEFGHGSSFSPSNIDISASGQGRSDPQSQQNLVPHSERSVNPSNDIVPADSPGGNFSRDQQVHSNSKGKSHSSSTSRRRTSVRRVSQSEVAAIATVQKKILQQTSRETLTDMATGAIPKLTQSSSQSFQSLLHSNEESIASNSSGATTTRGEHRERLQHQASPGQPVQPTTNPGVGTPLVQSTSPDISQNPSTGVHRIEVTSGTGEVRHLFIRPVDQSYNNVLREERTIVANRNSTTNVDQYPENNRERDPLISFLSTDPSIRPTHYIERAELEEIMLSFEANANGHIPDFIKEIESHRGSNERLPRLFESDQANYNFSLDSPPDAYEPESSAEPPSPPPGQSTDTSQREVPNLAGETAASATTAPATTAASATAAPAPPQAQDTFRILYRCCECTFATLYEMLTHLFERHKFAVALVSSPGRKPSFYSNRK